MIDYMPKWITASILYHAEQTMPDVSLVLVGSKYTDYSDLFELNIDGPIRRKISHNTYHFLVTVNLMINVSRDQENIYKTEELIAKGLALFTPIKIYKYGGGLEDTEVFVGCLNLEKNNSQAVSINRLGGKQISQVLISAGYEITLEA